MLLKINKFFSLPNKNLIMMIIIIIPSYGFTVEKPVFSIGFKGEVKTQEKNGTIISDFPSALNPDGYKESIYLKYKQIFLPEFNFMQKITLYKNHRYRSHNHFTRNFLLLRLNNSFHLKPASFFSSSISLNYERKTKENNINDILEDKLWFPLMFKWIIWRVIEFKIQYSPELVIKDKTHTYNQEISNMIKCSIWEKKLIIKTNYDLIIKNINNTNEKSPYLLHKFGTEITFNFK